MIYVCRWLCKAKEQTEERKPLFFFCPFLIRRDTVSKNLITPYGILILSAAIAGIALDGIDNTIFAFLHNADMIRLPILRTGAAFVIPIEEND